MKLEASQEGLLPGYLASFDRLIGDKRTGITFRETVKGIIGAGSLVCQRIAASSAVLSEAKESGQRVSRMASRNQTLLPAMTPSMWTMLPLPRLPSSI